MTFSSPSKAIHQLARGICISVETVPHPHDERQTRKLTNYIVTQWTAPTACIRNTFFSRSPWTIKDKTERVVCCAGAIQNKIHNTGLTFFRSFDHQSQRSGGDGLLDAEIDRPRSHTYGQSRKSSRPLLRRVQSTSCSKISNDLPVYHIPSDILSGTGA